MSKNNTVIYVGVCKNLSTRLINHRLKVNPKSFTSKYNVNKLVYFEEYEMLVDAIAREKQIKNWRREWKLNLVRSINPDFADVSGELIVY